MSINNFKYENILVVIPDFRLYATCFNEECFNYEKDEREVEKMCEHLEHNYYDFNTEGYNMYIEDMQVAMGKMKVAKNIEWCDLDKYDGDRNYIGKIIGEFRICDKEGYIYKTIQIVIRSGYYEGGNIDYVIEDENCGYCDITKAQEKKLDEQVETLCNKIEKLLKKIGGEEYVKVAQFSNGEAMYNKVK